jgi:methylated-DNA-protein-cysteine methyltransferase-like protein
MTAFRDEVLRTVARIPPGKVTSYGAVAAMAGRPRAARGVGWILNRLKTDADLPWWRVVSGSGEISTFKLPGPAGLLQRELLVAEGVSFDARGRVSAAEFWWNPYPDP